MSKKKQQVTVKKNTKGQTVRTTLQPYKFGGRTGYRQKVEILEDVAYDRHIGDKVFPTTKPMTVKGETRNITHPVTA